MDPSAKPALPPTLGFVLHDAARLLRKRFEQRARGVGLTRAQWQVLAALARNEGIPQSGLADLLELEPITVGRILDKLEQCEMIERRAHPTDRRAKLLYLQPKAYPMLETMRDLATVTREEALVGISESEREMMMKLLSLMRGNLIAACATAPDEATPAAMKAEARND